MISIRQPGRQELLQQQTLMLSFMCSQDMHQPQSSQQQVLSPTSLFIAQILLQVLAQPQMYQQWYTPGPAGSGGLDHLQNPLMHTCKVEALPSTGIWLKSLFKYLPRHLHFSILPVSAIGQSRSMATQN